MTISARFKTGPPGFTLDVDLEIPARGITALFGPSGCGKTSLLRAIAGLDRHAAGYLKIDQAVWQSADHFVPVHRRALGYVFQEASLFTHLNVRENLEYGAKRSDLDQPSLTDSVVGMLDLNNLLERRPDTLSGGERQRVAIGRALAAQPSLLLMDEPLAALDHKRKQEILPYLESLHESLEIPMIYVSHSIDEVARLADHMILMESGKIIATGPIGDLLTRFDLPMAHDHDAGALIEATVAAQDHQYHLTMLQFAGGQLAVMQRDLEIGSAVRLRVAARDVSLTLERQADTSILNIFPATVAEIATEGQSHMLVRLQLGDTNLLASVTRKSADVLQLKQGKAVFAQVKSVALLY